MRARRSRSPRRALSGVALLAAMAVAGGARADSPLDRTPDGREIRLTFSDEFDTFRRWNGHAGIWHTSYGRDIQRGTRQRTLPDNGELQLYVDPDVTDASGHSLGLSPFSLDNGTVGIVARPTPPELMRELGGYRYISGVITTQPVFSQTYGYFEMRAELPGGKGLWPAFWLLPADGSWPPEIDVMESIGDPGQVFMTPHSGVSHPNGIERHISPSGFHTFAVSWDPQQLVFYIDGREQDRQATPPDMHKPMYLLANLAVGGNWPGAPNARTHFPAIMRIDYIRAYRFVHE